MLLKYKADRRTLAFVVIYFGLVVSQWAWHPMSWYLAIPLFVATCCFSWFCAVITHNTVHCPMFESRTLNRIIQVVLTLTYGHPVSSYVSGHNLSHHRHTQEAEDLMRTTKMRYRWNLLNLLLFFPTVGIAISRGDVKFASAMRRERPNWFRQLLLEGATLIGITVALLILDWQKALLYWVAPHMWAAWGIICINFLQHDGTDDGSEYNHSRNFVGRVFGWWTFNNGFHSIHHVDPGLHWSLLRDAHQEQLVGKIDPRLDEPSIFRYAFRTFIWPGKRLHFTGRMVELPPEIEDKDWIPSPSNPIPPGVSLGVEG